MAYDGELIRAITVPKNEKSKASVLVVGIRFSKTLVCVNYQKVLTFTDKFSKADNESSASPILADCQKSGDSIHHSCISERVQMDRRELH